MASKERHISKCRRAIKRGVQYDSFDMPIQKYKTKYMQNNKNVLHFLQVNYQLIINSIA